MALLDIATVWSSDEGRDLFKRFLGGVLVAAKDIANEAIDFPNHTERLAWANTIFSGTTAEVNSEVRKFIRYAASENAALQAGKEEIPDQDIQFIVNSLVNKLLGLK